MKQPTDIQSAGEAENLVGTRLIGVPEGRPGHLRMHSTH